jgi:hypothetical protein
MYLDRVRALNYLQTAKLCKNKTRNISWQDLDAASILSMSGVPESNIVVNEDGSVTLTPPPAPTLNEEDPFLLEASFTDNLTRNSGGLFYNPTSAPTAASVPYYITANNAALDMIGRLSITQTHTSTNKWKPRSNLLFALSSTSRVQSNPNLNHEKEEQEDDNLITDNNIMDTLFLRMQLSSLPPGVDDQDTPEPLMYDTFFMSSANTDTDADTII